MKKSDPDVPAKPSVQVLERMFTLIDVLASREDAISLKEISEKTGLHPSTTHRILNDLVLGRFVDHPQAGSYRLGMRLLELGNLVKGRLNVRDAAHRSHAVTALALPGHGTRLREWTEQQTGLTLGIGIGMAPPDRPVPAPRGTTGTFMAWQTCKIRDTCASFSGKATAKGMRR